MLVGQPGSVGELSLIRMVACCCHFCRLPRDTNKRDFQSLANKTFVPADAGLALPRDNRQVMTLQDRVQKVRSWLLLCMCSMAVVLVGLLALQQSSLTIHISMGIVSSTSKDPGPRVRRACTALDSSVSVPLCLV